MVWAWPKEPKKMMDAKKNNAKKNLIGLSSERKLDGIFGIAAMDISGFAP